MKKKLDQLKDKLFEKIHHNNLIYNTCWEDPRIDRALLQFDENSEIVMITSAGCNALDYLLDQPKSIHCIDLNFRQNALLELKKSIIKKGDFDMLFKFFGSGKHQNARNIYEALLRDEMTFSAHKFWDDKIDTFYSSNPQKTFYFKGTSGSFAWIFKKYLDGKKERKHLIKKLFNSDSIKDQREAYAELEPLLLNKMVLWMMQRHITMSLLGVPRAQRQLILNEYKNGMADFIKENLRHIFTEIPIDDNYFWRLYIKGRYSKNCCPSYLKKENFELLKNNLDKISIDTSSVSQFLKDNPKEYSHFILLDHQDWMSHHAPEALREEWELILQNSRPGTKILLRSAAQSIDFLPKFVLDQIDFVSDHEKTKHKEDRVGTYGSTYLGIVA